MKRKEGTFTMLYDDLAKRKDLSAMNKLVYARLCRYVSNDGTAFPKQSRLAEDLGTTQRAVSESLARLKELGMIDVNETRKSHRYRILSEPKAPIPVESSSISDSESIRCPGHISETANNVSDNASNVSDSASRISEIAATLSAAGYEKSGANDANCVDDQKLSVQVVAGKKQDMKTTESDLLTKENNTSAVMGIFQESQSAKDTAVGHRPVLRDKADGQIPVPRSVPQNGDTAGGATHKNDVSDLAVKRLYGVYGFVDGQYTTVSLASQCPLCKAYECKHACPKVAQIAHTVTI